MNREQKLERFAERASASLKDAIIPMDNGYLVFGAYQIQPIKNQKFVVRHYDNAVAEFGSKRSAISWCIAEKYRQYKLSQDIVALDSKKYQLESDIRSRQRVAERSRRQEFYDTVSAKLEPKISYYNAVSAELEKCLYSAKYLQYRGFNNETARHSRG